jgi:hypothetical protein
MVRVTPFALRASLALLGAAALAAGCGPSAPDPVTDKDGTLRLRLGDPEYAMEPGAIKVRSGRIRILARNEGTLTHNVKVEEATDEEGAVPIVYGGTATMQPGERAPGSPSASSPAGTGSSARSATTRTSASTQSSRSRGRGPSLRSRWPSTRSPTARPSVASPRGSRSSPATGPPVRRG